MHLTDQQQAIVQHELGPARVFAVAGAGKTTAMVHRIERLVSTGIFPAKKVLATSFSRASVQDLTQALSQWSHCRDVRTRTLHQLGNYVIKCAIRGRFLSDDFAQNDLNGADLSLFYRSLAIARKQNVEYKSELNSIDQEDFLAYVSACKGNLCYPDLSNSDLPETGLAIASEAAPPSAELSWYLDLYKLYEQVRLEQGWITFDDMLMTGWEMLVRHQSLREQVWRQMDCVLVDEFQDVNLAQFEILDLVTEPHRNYMVIGDDDQTIYEWRGAQARFILDDFQQRYDAVTYEITDNFRCDASQIAIANAVIQHNKNRYPKRLSLTKGFQGNTQIKAAKSLQSMGRLVVQDIEAAIAQGQPRAEIAVLVRIQAQTPYIEQFLIEANIPYGGPRLQPFYARSEIANFLAYGRLAQWQAQGLAVGQGLSSETETVQALWDRACRIPPLRYLKPDLKRQIWLALRQTGQPLATVLTQLLPELISRRDRQRVEALIDWWQDLPDFEDASEALAELDDALNYQKFLLDSSGSPETGAGKAAGVVAMIDYAQDKGSLFDFLAALDTMIQKRQTQQVAGVLTQGDRVWLDTIHQAKGLEWPFVLVPNCNQGFLPFGRDLDLPILEEERRLFYVAVTRSQAQLHLYHQTDEPLSQFLVEAKSKSQLAVVNKLRDIFETPPIDWRAAQILTVIRSVQSLYLDRFLTHWWTKSETDKAIAANQVQCLFNEVEAHQLSAKLKLDPSQVKPWQLLLTNDPNTGSPLATHSQAAQVATSSQSPAIADLTDWLQQLQAQPDPQPEPGNLLGILKAGDRVTHRKFGQGEVVRIEIDVERQDPGERITINFQKFGTKRIWITEKFCTLSLVDTPTFTALRQP